MNKALLSLLSFVFLIGLSGSVGAITYTVCSFGCDYASIQTAINAASNGDSIEVWNGTYNENVKVNKSVNLIGDGADITIVNASNPNGHVFEITANWVNISGFTVRGAKGVGTVAGIYVNLANNNNISDNVVINNKYGIFLQISSNSRVRNNIASDNTCGICLKFSGNNSIQDNDASLNTYGILLDESSSNNRLTNNNAGSNDYGIYLESFSNYNTITNNTASNNDYGIYLYWNSNYNTIANNTVNSNDNYGIWLDTSSENIITNNNLAKNWYGIALSSSNANSITYNNANYNYGIGVYLQNSNNNIVMNNHASFITAGIGNGISLYFSSNNTITNNNASSNSNMGVFISGSEFNTISNNIANSNGAGIYLDTGNNFISDNAANSNIWYGIYLTTSSNNNSLVNNTVSSNKYGIEVDSKYNIIRDNNIDSNTNYGLYLYFSEGNNTIYHNNIKYNSIQTLDSNPANNDWHHPTLLEGNYWSDYAGVDDGSGVDKHAIAGDGIGDTLIPHPSSNYDYYPFIIPNGWKTKEIDRYIQSLPNDAFKNNPEKRRDYFSDKLDRVYGLMEDGRYQKAIDTLEQNIRIRTDGCFGGNPNDDWITNCTAQEELLDMVDELIDYLETLL